MNWHINSAQSLSCQLKNSDDRWVRRLVLSALFTFSWQQIKHNTIHAYGMIHHWKVYASNFWKVHLIYRPVLCWKSTMWQRLIKINETPYLIEGRLYLALLKVSSCCCRRRCCYLMWMCRRFLSLVPLPFHTCNFALENRPLLAFKSQSTQNAAKGWMVSQSCLSQRLLSTEQCH